MVGPVVRGAPSFLMVEVDSCFVRTPRAREEDEVVPSFEDDEDIPPLEEIPDDEDDFFFDNDNDDLPPLQEVSDEEDEDEENLRFHLAQMNDAGDVQMGEESQYQKDNTEEGLPMNAIGEDTVETSDDGFSRIYHTTVTGSCRYLPFICNLLTSSLRGAMRSQRQFAPTGSTTATIP